MSSKRSYIAGNIQTSQGFRHAVLAALSKYSTNHTTKTATSQMKELMTEHITNTQRMNIFISTVAQQNQHMKSAQRKEQIKIFGLAGQIFQQSLLPFLPKIVAILQKKIKEGDNNIQQSCAESFGLLVKHLLMKSTLSNDDQTPIISNDDRQQFSTILKQLFANISHASKLMQMGGSLCLTRVIQNAPVELLNQEIERICHKLHEALLSNTCKSHSSLLECLISLILSVENEFERYAANYLPLLLENMGHSDWNTRKMAIDVVYTLAAIIQEVLQPFKYQVLEALNHCRFDKIKPVREAAIEAINVIKQISSPQDQEYERKVREQKKQKEKSRKSNIAGSRATTPIDNRSGMASPRSENHKVQDSKTDVSIAQSGKSVQRKSSFLKKSQMSQLVKRSPKQTKAQKMNKSIFKGPTNPNFFVGGGQKNPQVPTQVQVGVYVKEPSPMQKQKLLKKARQNLDQAHTPLKQSPTRTPSPKQKFSMKLRESIQKEQMSKLNESSPEIAKKHRQLVDHEQAVNIMGSNQKRGNLNDSQCNYNQSVLSEPQPSQINSKYLKNQLYSSSETQLLNNKLSSYERRAITESSPELINNFIDGQEQSKFMQVDPPYPQEKGIIRPRSTSPPQQKLFNTFQPQSSALYEQSRISHNIQPSPEVQQQQQQQQQQQKQLFYQHQLPNGGVKNVSAGNLSRISPPRASNDTLFRDQTWMNAAGGNASENNLLRESQSLPLNRDQAIEILKVQKVSSYISQSSFQQQQKIVSSMNTFQQVTRNEMNQFKSHISSLQRKLQQVVNVVFQLQNQNASLRQLLTQSNKSSFQPNKGALPAAGRPTSPTTDSDEKVIWEKCAIFVKENRINQAYECVLGCPNDFTVIRLMGRTGVILSQLSEWVMDKVVMRLAKILEQKDFVEFLIPWLSVIPDEKLVLSRAETNSILKQTIFSVMEWLKHDPKHTVQLTEMQIYDLNRIYNYLAACQADGKRLKSSDDKLMEIRESYSQ